MKKSLLLGIFSLVVQSLFAQCQPIQAVIANSTPPIMPADTGWIDICLGDELFLSGEGFYPSNGQTYNQSDATSTFQWSFGDGAEAVGSLANHTYTEPGAYLLNLIVTDTLGCTNDNFLNQRVRVRGFKEMPTTQFSAETICEGESVEISIFPLPTNTFNFGTDTLFVNPDTVFIPDGDGTAVLSTIQVDAFPDGAILENANQLKNICVNLEHSWMRDLNITLTAPNGNTILLHDHPGQTGGQVYLGEPIDNDGGFPMVGVGYDYAWANDAPNPTWIEYANATQVSTLPADVYSSFEPFSNLIGTPLNGNWTLTITDLWASDNGFLFYWSVLFDEAEITLAINETFEVNFVTGEWLPDNSITFSNSNSLIATPTTTTNYTYQITDDFGCQTDYSYEIVVVPADSAICQPCDSFMVSLPDTQMFTCSGDGTNTIQATIQSPTNELDFQWMTVDGNFADSEILDSSFVDITSAGTYVLTTTVPVSGCLQMDTIVITPTIVPTLDAGLDTTFFCGIPELYQLNGSTDGTDVSTPLWTTVDGEISFGANTFMPVADEPGTYVLNLLDNISNCFLQDSVEVFLHPVLIDSLSATDAGCEQTNGTAAIYTAANPADVSINWSNGDTTATVTNLAPGSYSLTITDGNCTQEGAVFIDESEECDVTIRGRIFQGNICHPDSAFLDWFPDLTVRLEPLGLERNAPLSDGSYEFVVPPGNYSVIVDDGPYIPNNTFAISCPATNTISVDLPTPGSISEENNFYYELTVATDDFNQKNQSLNIFPNPSNGQFQITYELSTPNQIDLKILSLAGKEILPIFENKAQTSGEHTENLNLENLPDGVYLIQLATENGVFINKIIKQ